MIRYVGWYSNRMRGDREKQKNKEKEAETPDDEVEIIDVSRLKPSKIQQPTWRKCIKKVWKVDPLKYPYCQGEMKTISFIKDRDIIRKILEHLDLWCIPKQPRPPPENKFTLPRHNPCPPVTEQDDSFNDGWPSSEEPVFSTD